jgi:RNA polymerase sigma-54 factor
MWRQDEQDNYHFSCLGLNNPLERYFCNSLIYVMAKNMEMRHSIQPQQKLFLGQAMQRALEILQMPSLELGIWVQAEIEKNPLLELLSPPFAGSTANRVIPEIPCPPSLYDHLMAQIREAFSGDDRKIAEGLLEQLDEKGFLIGDAPEPILQVLQTFDPPGIFARDLREAFLLQLKKDSSAYLLIQEGYDDLMKGKFRKLEKKYGNGAIQTILRLRTRPSACFDTEMAQPIYPDLRIAKVGRKWKIESVEDSLPKFRIKTELLSLPNLPKEERKTMRNFAVSAKWIQRCIERRRNLLLDLTKHLLEQKSSTPKDLALLLGVHESTISRALSEKYIDTPKGYLPLRALMTKGGPKELLVKLVAEENKASPLTDEELAQALNIARRTVTKYRQALHLGSAAMRKRLR